MSDWMPSLAALRAFEATARHLSFVRAAEELHVTPSAVKQLVRRLEEALGQPLIVRDGRGLRLTEAGETGLGDLARGFAHLEQGVARIRAHDGRRRLVLTVEPSFAAAWLVPRLDRFRALCPDIDVLVDSSSALADLDRNAADVAIRFGAAHGEGQVVHRLFEEALCAFCAPALARGPGGLETLAGLNRVPLIHWDIPALGWGAATRAWMGWEPWLHRLGASHVDPRPGIRFRDYNLALQAAIAGQGVVLGSRPVLQDHVDAGLLAVPFPDTVGTDLGYDVTATAAAAERSEVQAFIGWVTAEAGIG